MRRRPPLSLPVVIGLALTACAQDGAPTAPDTSEKPEVAAALAVGDRIVNSLADPGDGTCDARQCTPPADPDVDSVHEYDRPFTDHALIGNGSGSGIANENGNVVGNVSPYSAPVDPRLGTLADYGGSTRTIALLAGSPALDAASAAACPGTDQRGVSRPQGEWCDMGSYEKE